MRSETAAADRSEKPGLPGRRSFLQVCSTAAAGWAAASATGGVQAAEQAAASAADAAWGGGVLDSPPTLQNPSSTGVTVVWAVRGPATGWVEYGPTEALGKRASATSFGLEPLAARFLSARLEGLEPGKPTFYRVAAAAVNFRGAYKIERGEAAFGPIHRCLPLDPAAETATFAVINDTHENAETLAGLTAALAERPAELLVWNGDVVDDIRSDDQLVGAFLRPAGKPYAALAPVLFTSGNHDVRGVHARALPQVVAPWPGEGPTGKCFAVRQGPLALIGLDTGEDKPDRHPVFAGLAAFEPYRIAQAEWLAQALARPEIASAPFLVACCHIPLWGRPGENGGDSDTGYAYYQRQSQTLWHPLLAKAGAQLLLCGHTHAFRYDPPNERHAYPQIVGGGPKPAIATLLRGTASRSKLELVAHRLDGSELGRWDFRPRR